MKLKQLVKNTIVLTLLATMATISAANRADAAIPAWLLKKLQNIKPQPASINPIIIPGWQQQQAQVLAESFITGKVDSVEAGVAEEAMSEVGEYKGKKTPVIVAKGNMAGGYPVGPYNLTDPKVTMVFDSNGNMLKREFIIPANTCSAVDARMARAGLAVPEACKPSK
jgi:hypothetical protein